MADQIHVHIITPLISQGFRDDAPLRAAFEGLCRITSSVLDKGPASVESAVDEVLAAPGVVDAAIGAERDGADAIVIDCMLDPGLDAAREAVSIPVLGAGESGLSAAAEHGRFSIVTVLDRQAPMFRNLARRHGLADRLASVRGIGVPVLALETDRDASIAKTTPACAAAMSEDGALAIVFGCTGMLEFADPVAKALNLPDGRIIDPLPNAVRAAILAARSDAPAHPKPERKRIAGFEAWKDLAQLMRPGADA
ncbi:aspartate/glutamate racemase family protein [Roseovarius sp.]|uniref:aspartate/glutamate racemase family protein n=1 Tax=Roseovarius sp. TaxID=1486281 RepID=UPI003566E4D9